MCKMLAFNHCACGIATPGRRSITAAPVRGGPGTRWPGGPSRLSPAESSQGALGSQVKKKTSETQSPVLKRSCICAEIVSLACRRHFDRDISPCGWDRQRVGLLDPTYISPVKDHS